MTRNKLSTFSVLLTCLFTFVVGCSGSSSSSSSSTTIGSSGGSSSGGSVTLSGGGVKGPMAFAVVTAYEIDTSQPGFKGDPIDDGSTNGQAQITGISIPASVTPPFLLEFVADASTVDLTTGQAPVITVLRTVVTEELLAGGENLYATPLTTMATDLAIKNADFDGDGNADGLLDDPSDKPQWGDRDKDGNIDTGLGDGTATVEEFLSALTVAAGQVKGTLGFGIDEDVNIFDTPPLIDSSTTSEEQQEDSAAYRAAVEAVTAIVAQINDATDTGNPNDVLDAITDDLSDGEIDGEVDGQPSDIFSGDEDAADASLEIFDQDPSSLPIPNSNLRVGDVKNILTDETGDTGNDSTTVELNANEVNLKVATTDPDLDDDGVTNDEDAFPLDSTEQKDSDKDGIGDNSDTDNDNDGVANDEDAFEFDATETTDTDGDGVGNNADTDDDGDGVADSEDDFPLDASRSDKTDQDSDGWPTEQDSDDTDPQVPGTSFAASDPDSDGLANDYDDDDDGDGVADGNDAFPLDATESRDLDGDGIGDNSDTDIDGDGVANENDAFPRNALESTDTDGDGIGNNADEDDDGDKLSDLQEEQGGRSDPLDRDTDDDGVLDNVDQAPRDPDVQFDSDRDGIDNREDNCPLSFNPQQLDLDGDGKGDACDKDIDGDSVLNVDDAFPFNSAESSDSDQDGIGNNEDTDDDNDGVLDDEDEFPTDAAEHADLDGDGIGDAADTDRDGDGVDNDNDAFPLDASETTDTDGDGIGNNADGDDDGDGVLDGDDVAPLDADASTDTDGDGTPNSSDTDDDNDGVDDAQDAFPLNANESSDNDSDGVGDNADTDDDNDGVLDGNDAFPNDPTETKDTDGDGIGNNADTDDDGDGVADAEDAFPLNPNESTDSDGDGVGNNADPDDDNDGVLDVNDANPTNPDGDGDGVKDGRDNCPSTANNDQVDTDGDGAGNACDADDDNDGVNDDAPDSCPLTPNANSDLDGDGTDDACDSDRDGDSFANNVDNCPNVNNDQTDTDGDGLGDACDVDNDLDGINDGIDNCPATANPNQEDFDHDGKGDACDLDDDNDGLSDSDEAAAGTDPLDKDSDDDGVTDNVDAFPMNANETKDSDNDGTGDNADTDDDNDGVSDDQDAFPLNPNESADNDGDGLGDNADVDDDNDGVLDENDAFPNDANESADADGDGTGDNADTDDDNDGVSDDQDAFPKNAEESVDTDGDGIGNNADTDDDGDGVADDNDAFPLNANESSDADGDGTGDNADTDDDNDGVSDADEELQGTNPLNADTDADGVNDGDDVFPLDPSESADSDEDGVGDNGDNCPNTANLDQADADQNGIGDACETTVDLNGFWIEHGTITSVTASVPQGSEDLCPHAQGDAVASASHWTQEIDGLLVSFAHIDIDASGVLDGNTANLSFTQTEYHQSANGDIRVETMGTAMGTYDSASDTVSATTSIEVNYYEAGSQTPMATCSFDQSSTFERFTEIAVSSVLPSGVHWYEAREEGMLNGMPVFEFERGEVTDSGETIYYWDGLAQTPAWVQDTGAPESYMLDLTGGSWVKVLDEVTFVQYSGNNAEFGFPGAADQNIYGNIEVSLQAASLAPATPANPMLPFLEGGYEEGIDKTTAFADTSGEVYVLQYQLLSDNYEVWCDDDWFSAPTLDCSNLVPLVSQYNEQTQSDEVTSWATAITDMIVADAGSVVVNWNNTLHIQGGPDMTLVALLEGDTSGTTGATGSVLFYEAGYNAMTGADEFTQVQGVMGQWVITEPVTGLQVLELSVPETGLEAYQIDDDERTQILTVINDAVEGAVLRRGVKVAAGGGDKQLAFNDAASAEIIAAFGYTPPSGNDTDGDSWTDDQDNCPNDYNPDQADSDGNGVGDVCEGGGGTDSDGDGVEDSVDNCPGVPNPGQEDANGNGVGDACEGGGGTDSDGDGYDDSVDNCPSVYNPDQADSNGFEDGDGVGDACETVTDTDGDGFPDADDDFINLASEWRDSDGDGTGDNSDTCPYTSDATCTNTSIDMSGVYLLSIGQIGGSEVLNAAGDACEAATDFVVLVNIEQIGTQLLMHGKGKDEFLNVGSVDVSGNFTFLNDQGVQFIDGFFDGTAWVNATFSSTETTTGGVDCVESGGITSVAPVAVADATTLGSAGLTWVETYHEFDPSTQQDVVWFEFGTITDSVPEAQFYWDFTGSAWAEFSVDSLGNQNYLTASGPQTADDLFIISSYTNSNATAVVNPTAGGTDAGGGATTGGTAVNYEELNVDLAELDVSGLPALTLLSEEWGQGLLETDVFSAGARAYVSKLTWQADSYMFWCDDGAPELDPLGLNCRNAKFVDETTVATSLDDVVTSNADWSTQTGGTSWWSSNIPYSAIWIGQGMDSGGEYQIDAYLVSDDGNVNGTTPMIYYAKIYQHNGQFFVLGSAPYSVSDVGGNSVVEVPIDGVVKELADRGHEPGHTMVFVESTLDSTPLVRQGEVLPAAGEQLEILYNTTARDDIVNTFSPLP